MYNSDINADVNLQCLLRSFHWQTLLEYCHQQSVSKNIYKHLDANQQK